MPKLLSFIISLFLLASCGGDPNGAFIELPIGTPSETFHEAPNETVEEIPNEASSETLDERPQDSLTSTPKRSGGNGEPITGDGSTRVIVFCIDNTESVAIHVRESPISETKVTVNFPSNSRIVPSFKVEKNSNTYKATAFELTIDSSNGESPGSVRMTVDGQTLELSLTCWWRNDPWW